MHPKVLDFTWHVAGPYATLLLLQAGAEVIKVERPGAGDPSRSLGPYAAGAPDREHSETFASLNAGKRSITLNLKSGEGRLAALELAKWADLVVDSFSPGVMERLGLEPEDFWEAGSTAAVCSISSFGEDGPRRDWRATPFTLAAMAGLVPAPAERTPTRPAVPIDVERLAGQEAAGQIKAAFVGGMPPAGKRIEVCLLDAVRAAAKQGLQPAPAASTLARAPAPGEHNREVYCGLLGFSPGELVFLRQTGAI